MKRIEFTKKVKLAAWDRCNGHCEGCGVKLRTGNIVYDHIIPLELYGESVVENCKVVCRSCDAPKTKADQGRIAKTRHIREKHTGAYQSRTPMACGKNSPWKKKMNGKVVPRWAK